MQSLSQHVALGLNPEYRTPQTSTLNTLTTSNETRHSSSLDAKHTVVHCIVTHPAHPTPSDVVPKRHEYHKSDQERRLSLHHSYVISTEIHHTTMPPSFNSGGSIDRSHPQYHGKCCPQKPRKALKSMRGSPMAAPQNLPEARQVRVLPLIVGYFAVANFVPVDTHFVSRHKVKSGHLL